MVFWTIDNKGVMRFRVRFSAFFRIFPPESVNKSASNRQAERARISATVVGVADDHMPTANYFARVNGKHPEFASRRKRMNFFPRPGS
jgi:hypothetical protein